MLELTNHTRAHFTRRATLSTSESTSKPICHRLKGLSQGQMKHCFLYEDHMDSVEEGVKNSLAECQRQFKNHRWNCTAMTEHRTFFGPFLKFGTLRQLHTIEDGQFVNTYCCFLSGHREAAFVQAIISAGVMHAIARSCRDGLLTRCGCSTMERPAGLYKDWIWRGCGDNLEYAYKLVHEYALRLLSSDTIDIDTLNSTVWLQSWTNWNNWWKSEHLRQNLGNK